jgi:hypothetical protein
LIAPIGAATLTSNHAGEKVQADCDHYDDDESMHDSLQDLIEAAGATHVALDLRKNSSNPLYIVKLFA